jgi:hydroxymethylbilane synthase
MLPISLRPNGRRAVIVGGGEIAARKAEALVHAGFPIFVVAQQIGERLRSILAQHGGAFAERAYERRDLEGAALVIAATNDRGLNERLVADARATGALACDASQFERGDFTIPATLRVGELTITVDTTGNAPAFSARVIRELREHFGSEYADAVHAVGRMRKYVMNAFVPEERAEILRALSERPIEELAAMQPVSLTCATRESPLATIQSRKIAALLARRGIETRMLGVTTHGDRDRAHSIDQLGEVNVFVKELEVALRERRADFAVHSCKDLPSELAADMRIAAFSHREDPRDAFCSERYASFDSLPAGAVVGTSSPRRRSQLAALRPDLRYEPIRGNVDTRLRKLRDAEYDAIVLAMAGLNRLQAAASYVVPFGSDQVVPAVGQGVLAVETRTDNVSIAQLVRDAVNDERVELCAECERAALRAMRAGCSAPIGIHARLDGEAMIVEGAYGLASGRVVRERAGANITKAAQARTLGEQLAAELIRASKPEIEEVRG